MENPIVLTKVSKAYEKVSNALVVVDFTLSILQGEFFCLVGPSGCGKTTILKMVAGLEEPTGGEILKPDQVGMVFQSGALLPWLTVEDNVTFAAKMAGFSFEKVKRVTKEYLEMVKLGDSRSKYPRELSGGQRQRVGIARALVVESEALLLDEPFSALDPLTTEELRADLLRIWKNTKKTILMVSHLLEEAAILADRIGVMKEGKLKAVIGIDLPRPRNENDLNFLPKVEEIRTILTQ